MLTKTPIGSISERTPPGIDTCEVKDRLVSKPHPSSRIDCRTSVFFK
jgi:hypothetical protein